MRHGAMGRLTWAWPSTWTWAAPMAPDPTLPAEVLRRGFLESA